MATSISKRNNVLYICMLLIHLFKPIVSSGAYFRLIKGIDHQDSVAGTSPVLREEFFQCAREESCTHVVKLSHGYMVVYGIDELEKRNNEALSIYEKVKLQGKFNVNFTAIVFYRNEKVIGTK